MSTFSVSGLTSILNQLLPEPHAGLLAGLLFGTKTSLSVDLYNALVKSGTLHIIALSGMNISILSRMVTNSLLPVVGRRIASLLILLLVAWFVWFVGPSASIVRAAIMGGISVFAVLLGRQYWAILSWAIAVGVMLLVNVSWFFDISFQLSALATLGIILFGGEEKEGPVKDDLRLTLAAQVFTIPLIFFYFRRISLVSPLSNLAIGWLVGPLTGLGWATAIVGWIWLPAARLIAWIDWVFLEYLLLAVTWTSKIPFASLSL